MSDLAREIAERIVAGANLDAMPQVEALMQESWESELEELIAPNLAPLKVRIAALESVLCDVHLWAADPSRAPWDTIRTDIEDVLAGSGDMVTVERERLREIEFVEAFNAVEEEISFCPVCNVRLGDNGERFPHDPDCWLARAIGDEGEAS